MATTLLSCPLCSQASFNTIDSLCKGLIDVVKRQITCPMCQEVSQGLDKFTVHMLCHSVRQQSQLCTSTCKHDSFSGRSKKVQQDGTEECLNADISFTEVGNVLLYYDPNFKSVSNCNSIVSSFRPQVEPEYNQNFKNVSNNSSITAITPLFSTPQVKNNSQTLKNTTFVLESFHDLCHKRNKSDFQLDNSPKTDENALRIADKKERHAQHLESAQCGFSLDNSVKPVGCNICGLDFPAENILIIHNQLIHSSAVNNHEPESEVKSADNSCNYPCFLCSKIFKMKGSLMVHMRVAHGSGKLTAKKCDGNKGLECTCSCSSCSKLSTKEQSLQNIKPHEGKQHECDVCFKMFTTKYFLKKHKRLHTGKCFRQRVSYLVHKRIHTGVMPYKCTACGKSFRYKVSQRTHKCPSQPPGTVVRQTGELIQKLLKQKQSNTHMVSVIDEFSLNDQLDTQSLSQQEQHNTASIDKNIVPLNEQTSSNYSLMDLHSTNRPHLENIVKDSLQYRSPPDSLNTNNVSNRLEICIDGISSNQQSRLYETCNKETEKEPPENPLSKSNKPMCHAILKENNASLESPVHMNPRVLENEQLSSNNKSCHISEATDFFRMVMSPHIASLPSSSEIFNISLPSSSLAGSYQTSLNDNVRCQYADKNIQQRFDRKNSFENETKNMLQVRAENAELNMTPPTTSDRSVIGQNNSKEIETMETLQKEILETINLESLKQILYGQCQ